MAHNAIPSGTVIKGEITAEEDFRLDGILEGNMQLSGKLIIGPKGSLVGNVSCVDIEVMGRFSGKADVSNQTILRSTANCTMELSTSTILIEAGAFFSGRCVMPESNTPPAM